MSLVSGSASLIDHSLLLNMNYYACTLRGCLSNSSGSLRLSSSVLSDGASPHDVCRRAATFSSHFGMTHCGGKWGLKERSRGLHVRVRTGMARESRHSWLESPFTTFLSLSLLILDHSHNAESYAGNVDSDMPPTRGSDALFFGNLDDPH